MIKKYFFTFAIWKTAFSNLMLSLMTASILVYLIVLFEATFAFHSRAMFSFLTPAFLFSYVYFIVGLCYIAVPLYFILHVLAVSENEYLSTPDKLQSFERKLALTYEKPVKLLFNKSGRIPREESREKSKGKLIGKWLTKLVVFKYKRIHHLGSLAVIIGLFWMDSKVSNPLPPYFILTFLLISISFIIISGKKLTSYVFMALTVLIAGSLFAHYQYYGIRNNINDDTKSSSSARSKPNVLLLVSDTTRRDHMTFYGYKYKTTPQLQQYAKEAVLYKNAYTTSAWTKPATASLVTGMSLVADTVHNGAYPISYRGLHMAELFKDNGYDTALFSANSNASSYFGHAKGYAYRSHSLPPEHIAYHKFIAVQFFSQRFNGRVSVKLKNNDMGLEEYTNYLKIEPGQVNKFIDGKIKPGIKLSNTEFKKYRQHMQNLLSKKVADEWSAYPKMLPAQDVWYYPLINSWYQTILYFYYFNLENAEGEIDRTWIKDQRLVEKFVDWNNNRNNSSTPKKPFFAHLQFMGPHTPYNTQLPYLLPHFDPDFNDPQYSPPTQHTPPSVPAPKISARELKNLIANYDNSIRNTDANIAKVLDYLDSMGELDNTIVVFTADHGEAFYEHFIYGHMNSLHSELIDIPLFFYWKNKLKPAKVSRPAAIIDIYPSLSVLTGVALSPALNKRLEGKSLFHINLKPLTDQRENFQLSIFTIVGSAWKMGKKSGVPFGLHTGVITEKGKLIRENEEIGKRFLYFSSTDKVEKREFYNVEHPNLPAVIKEHLHLLPKEPESWKLVN